MGLPKKCGIVDYISVALNEIMGSRQVAAKMHAKKK